MTTTNPNNIQETYDGEIPPWDLLFNQTRITKTKVIDWVDIDYNKPTTVYRLQCTGCKRAHLIVHNI